MPRYPFRCSGCQNELDLFLPMKSRDDPPNCSQCGGELKRVFFAPTVLIPGHFRGHVHTTGLKSELGPGPWEEMVARRNRWDSGYKGPDDTPQKARQGLGG